MERQEIREEALSRAREKVSDREPLKLMVKAVKALSEVERSNSDISDVFRDWYSLHFPELERELDEDDAFFNVLSDGVSRDELHAFSDMAGDSTGMDLDQKDVEMLNRMAKSLNEDRELKDALKQYISDIADIQIPNLSVLLGPVLSAKLIDLSGGLEDLAKSPASTVQVLGAEKALFSHLKGEADSPKHGVLFEHRFVRPLESEKRGKMARFLANKTVIAARMDLYGDKEKGENLRRECQEKFEELKG
jgi:nucleolar protein 56